MEELDDRLQVLCNYAIKLTLEPWRMEESDVETLRAAGYNDRAVVDANQVVSYYNYVNRVADGLGVELEPTWPDEVRRRRLYPIRDRYRGDPQDPAS